MLNTEEVARIVRDALELYADSGMVPHGIEEIRRKHDSVTFWVTMDKKRKLNAGVFKAFKVTVEEF